MKTIQIETLVGKICVDPVDGQVICDAAFETLASGGEVCLDFTGVTTLASAFLNASVGCLYASFRPDDLERRLVWKGLDQTDEAVIRFVQRNAIRFFTAKQSQKDALTKASLQVVES